MTEKESEQANALQNKLWLAVHELVDKIIDEANVPLRIEEDIRQELTESFRFWRR